MSDGVYAIEKGVPLPIPASSRKYPFPDMRTGTSFFVSIKDAAPTSVQSAAYAFARLNKGFRFSVRRMRGESGTRVWCLEAPRKKR